MPSDVAIKAQKDASTAVTLQLKRWGFAPETQMWEHFKNTALTSINTGIQLKAENSNHGFLIEKRDQDSVDTSFMNSDIAKKMTEICHENYPGKYDPEKKKDPEFEDMLAKSGFKNADEMERPLAIALERVGARAALESLRLSASEQLIR